MRVCMWRGEKECCCCCCKFLSVLFFRSVENESDEKNVKIIVDELTIEMLFISNNNEYHLQLYADDEKNGLSFCEIETKSSLRCVIDDLDVLCHL